MKLSTMTNDEDAKLNHQFEYAIQINPAQKNGKTRNDRDRGGCDMSENKSIQTLGEARFCTAN
ncbi:hypothetical protein DERP_004886 [Dermatophagoides pteronyssinus]|uniref:Uncharacterized protein n=1 Tax=Dermatophagoides pteronyssinus TaxID=6956 RepID=A0ABQ8JT94_DERPT|nr:hypothetical protein DERP_004886 [Dermatophagoides pteronyssinus]